MERHPRPADPAAGDMTDEAIAAARAIDALGFEPLILGYHPVARMNPYHALLYQQALRCGVGPIPIVRDERIPELTALARLGHRTILHLHWLNLVMAHATGPADATKLRKAFLARLDRYLGAGGRLAWTVHNILPHGAQFEDEEARLSADVVERADVVHILAPGTAEIVAPWFTIPPDKILEVAHPSYAGAYEDRVSREQARHELGIMPDELVFVVAGAIRAYKGLTVLLDAWDAMPTDGPPRRLLIAGGPSAEAGVPELLERAALHSTVLVNARQVPASEMQLFLRAADVAVLPYVRSLNSGALMLAVTFGLPVIVPAGGGLEAVVDPAFSLTFEAGDPTSLANALLDAGALVSDAARAAALDTAARHAPGPLSEQFASGVRARLGLPTSPSA
jgi:beta-1,4-mannosyltransferase